jgi:DNA-directed RNA polymerase specialized sigma24 family protein
MPRTRSQLDEAARRAEKLLEEMDPADLATPDADASDLRAIVDASRKIATGNNEQAEAVEQARRHGKSWTQIAAVLGVSRQAAKARFGEPASHAM